MTSEELRKATGGIGILIKKDYSQKSCEINKAGESKKPEVRVIDIEAHKKFIDALFSTSS